MRFSRDSVNFKESIVANVRQAGISDYAIFSLFSSWDALIRVWADQESIDSLRTFLSVNIDIHPEKQPEYLIVDSIAHVSEHANYRSPDEVREFVKKSSLRDLRDCQEKGHESELFVPFRDAGLLIGDTARFHPNRIQFYTLIRSMYNLEQNSIKQLKEIVTDASKIYNRTLYLTSGSSARAVIKGQVQNYYDIETFIRKISTQVQSVSAVTETMLVGRRDLRQSATIDFQKAQAFVAYKEFRELCPGAWQLGLSEQRKLEGMFAGIRDKLPIDKSGVLQGLLKAKVAESSEQLSQTLGAFFPTLERVLRDHLILVLRSKYGDWKPGLDALKNREGVEQANKDRFTLGDLLKVYKRFFMEKDKIYANILSDEEFASLMDMAVVKRNEFAHGYTDMRRWDELFGFFSEFVPVHSLILNHLETIR